MNKRCYRVIFSKTLQRFVVVSELAKTNGKSRQKQTLVFSLFASLVSVSESSFAETLVIEADKSVPKNQQPIILETSNGLPQINIQTPNEKGLSHNKYTKFDVDFQGAILNNSRKNAYTQQAGWVVGNPYLAKGEAKTILNEVNSNKASVLKGYVEVAGKKANVVVANPAGIYCDDCGIINAERTTFSTGKPQIQHGNLDAFIVEKGKVKIDGNGLNNSSSDYTEILARQAEINANIWSKKSIKIVAGKNTIKRDDTDDVKIIHQNQQITLNDKPNFAIDVSQLGGMYAGKIHLIGTEYGVGVSNAGQIGASSESVYIDVQGRVVNTGALNAAHEIIMKANENIENKGVIENLSGDIKLNSQTNIKNDGSIIARTGKIQKKARRNISQSGDTIARSDIYYNAPIVETYKTALITAGAELKNGKRNLEKLSANGSGIKIEAKNISLASRNLASGKLHIEAENINLDYSQNNANDIDIIATYGNIEANSTIFDARRRLFLTTPETLSLNNSYLSAKHIYVKQRNFNIENTVWNQTGSEDFHLKADVVSTRGSMFQTQGNFFVSGRKLENSNSTLSSKKSLDLSFEESVDSSNGYLIAGQSLNISSPEINNQHGVIEGHKKLTISADNLDNQAGKIRSKSAFISAKNINNKAISKEGSLIQSEDLSIETAQLDNQNTKAENKEPNQGIQATNLKINTDVLNNENGGIYTFSNTEITANKQLKNIQGELLSAKSININNGRELNINNQNGLIQANEAINFNSKSLENAGLIKTSGDLSISLKDNFVLNKPFEVGNNLFLKVEGNFHNNSAQTVGNKAEILASSVTNSINAEISAQETTFNTNELINRGLIDGYKTFINSKKVINIGTGKIYGNYVAFYSDEIKNQAENGTSATIAAREKLDFGVRSLTNRDHSLILSLGDMTIGGSLDSEGNAIGDAQYIDNRSATIEVLGNAKIYSANLINQNLNFTTKQKTLTPTEHDEYATSESGERLSGGFFDRRNREKDQFLAYYYTADGKRIESNVWFNWKFRREKNQTVVDTTDPAKILVGGNLYFSNSGKYINDKSQIIVGNKLHFAGDVENIDEQGVERTTDIGKFIISKTKKSWYSGKRRHRRRETEPKDYNYEHPDEYFDLGAVSLLENTDSFDANPTVDTRNSASTVQVIEVKQNLTAIADIKNQSPAAVKTVLPNVHLPQSSLYKINPVAEKGYFIETDPKFMQYRKWLSSDYMFDALRYNHDNVHKRLGDGFYEQRIINDQIRQLTGRRFVIDYQNDIEQYKSLMNNGINYAKKFNLTIGIGLTAEQMSELTNDMVWFINTEITLPNGQKTMALTPQVYLVSRNSNINSQGAVISANEIVGNIGKFKNSGIVAGRDLTKLRAIEIENQGIISGKSVDLSAKQSLMNLSGKIGASNSLSLSAGMHLEIASTLSESKNADGTFERSALSKLGSVKVFDNNGKISLHSGDKLALKAGVIDSRGSVEISAKDIDIGTLTTKNKGHYNYDADNYYRLNQLSEISSQIHGKNGITIASEKNTYIKQSDISSENDKILIASTNGNISIESGQTKESLETGSKSRSRGMLSKTISISQHQHHATNAVSSNVDGQNVDVISQAGNIGVKGSNIVAEKNTNIFAKNDISIVSDKNTYSKENYQETIKNGLMGKGSIGFTIGNKKETIEAANIQESATRSQVGSLAGHTNIQAGGHYQQTGSNIASRDGDVNITANSATIEAVHSRYKNDYKQSIKQKGLTVALNVPIIQAAQGMVQVAKNINESKNKRINAMTAVNAGIQAYSGYKVAQESLDAAKTLMQGFNSTNAKTAIEQAGINVSVAYGEQKSRSESYHQSEQAQASQIFSGGKITLTATGAGQNSNINLIGSDVIGKGGTMLNAENRINLQSAVQVSSERSNNKSTGRNVGISASLSAGKPNFGVSVGGNLGKGYGNGDELTHRHSYLGDANSQTVLQSGDDTIIKGAQVKGKGVQVNARNLHIESQQDTARYHGKQQNASAQLTVGLASSISGGGSFDRSKSDMDYRAVTEQSGIYAGKDGYHINVDGKVSLIGAAIASQADATQNKLKAKDFNQTALINYSNGSASAMGLNLGFSYGRDQKSSEDKALDEKYRANRINSDGTAATFHQANPTQAKSSPLKFGLNQNDVHSDDRYALYKILGGNLLGNDTQSEQKVSQTLSSIGAGQFDIASERGKKQLVQAQQNSEQAHLPLTPVERENLLKEAQLQRDVKKQFIKGAITPLTDEAYRTQFIAEHRLMTFEIKDGQLVEDPEIANALREEFNSSTELKQEYSNFENYWNSYKRKGGNIYKLREVSDQERKQLKTATYTDPKTGKEVNKVVISFNGIFTEIQDAAKFAPQFYVAHKNKDGEWERIYRNTYFVHNPKSSNAASELMVAGYHKILEGRADGLLGGLSNSGQQLNDLIFHYGGAEPEGLFIGSHSRGTMVVGNSLRILNTQANRDNKLLANTDVKMVGPAAHAATADKDFAVLQGFDENRSSKAAADRSIIIENHQNDWVGRIIGLNPYTVTTNIQNKGFFGTVKDIFGSEASPHNCYGLGNNRCATDGYRTPKNHPEKGINNRDRRYDNVDVMYPTYTIYRALYEINQQKYNGEKK